VVRIYSIATVDAHAKPMWHHKSVIALFHIVLRLLIDLIALTALALRQRRATAAEILVLRRQIALYKERGIKPRRIDPVTRISLALLSRFFNWRDAVVVVRPEAMIRWHRAGWKLFWRLKSRPGRPPIPLEVQTLIRRMANENPAWGQERIANELILKLGIQVSPRTVNKYLPRRSPLWVFLQRVLFGLKDVLKEKYDIRRDGGGYAGADASELVRPLSSIFRGDYLICGAPK
jgi:hypothetical protein